MNFAFFESLSLLEAQDYLARFLSETRRGFDQLAPEAQADGLLVDYSIESVPPLILWLIPKLQTFPLPEDPTVPMWIRQTREYAAGCYDFTESARIQILRTAFYFGEAFVRTFPQLRWGVGNQNSAEKNMPVVRGFRSAIELSPLLVVENMHRRSSLHRPTLESIYAILEKWKSYVVT